MSENTPPGKRGFHDRRLAGKEEAGMADNASSPLDGGTRLAFGCGTVVLALFGLAGLAAMVAGAASDAPAAGVGVGLLFVVVSAGGLALLRWAHRRASELARLRADAPDQPWAWRQEWRDGVIQGSSRRVLAAVLGGMSVFWLLTMSVITLAGWSDIRDEAGPMAIVGAFWLVGIILAIFAAVSVARALAFPATRLELDATPARLEGWLSGVIHGPREVHGAEIELAVECGHTTTRRTQGSSDSSTNTSTTIEWRKVLLLDGAQLERGAAGVEIPFAVRLPSADEVARGRDLPGGGATYDSSPGGGNVTHSVNWAVAVAAKLPGLDYDDRFVVPVAPGGAAMRAQPRPRRMPEVPAERLVERAPGRVEYEAEADVLVFPLRVSWLVWTLGFLAAAAALVFWSDELGQAGLGTAPLWVAGFMGLLFVLSLVGLALDPRRVEIHPDRIEIRRGVLGAGFHSTVARPAIADVRDEASLSQPPTYTVKVHCHDGKSFDVAPHGTEPAPAMALAARLRSILQLGPRAS